MVETASILINIFFILTSDFYGASDPLSSNLMQ